MVGTGGEEIGRDLRPMLWTMATRSHRIWLIEKGKLFLSCAIVAAAFVVGGSLAAESPEAAAANGIPANQVSSFSAHPYGLVNQEERSVVVHLTKSRGFWRQGVVKAMHDA